MKIKPCKAAIYTLLVGILFPLVLSLCYIAYLCFCKELGGYFLLRESLKVCEAFFGCAVFSLVLAFLWDYLYRRYEL